MIKIITTLITMVLVVGTGFGDDTLFVSYHWSGGHSPYKNIQVTILKNGATEVTGQKQRLPPINYQAQLDHEELAALSALVQSTEFFVLPEKDIRIARGSGQTELIIDMEGHRRSLLYSYRPLLNPVRDFIWKLITQATAIQAITSDGDIYSASGAVKPTHACMKALQPMALKAPLFEYLRTQENRQKAQWAFEALAYLTTPEQLAGFVSSELANAKRKDIILQVIGMSTGNIPNPHVKSLCPVYLTFIRNNYHRRKELSQIEKEVLSGFIYILGKERYTEAIPLFTAWFKEHSQPHISTDFNPLSKMGLAGLNALQPFLDSKSETHRVKAIELVTIASRTGPHCGFANPVSDSEYKRMIPVFSTSIIPKLSELSIGDTSSRVRKEAKQASVEIEKWIKEKENSTSESNRRGER